MKNVVLAAMLGMATLAPVTAPVQAASLTITTDNGTRYSDDYSWRRHHRHYAMRDYDRDNRRHWRRDRDRDRCHVRVHKRWHHHRLVIKRVWSCGYHRGW
ncbi:MULTISPECIES: hypothetical protein [unclassified Mesorhizobium]|uniref:hypothetical protein n=1 Tax=unclassified Mesorhizobium TaxID=325217 RepID=UPI000FCC3CAB|nr:MULTISPECIES: hypothetical protein [unclassified Mesorhizobium]RUW64283.1 hypothetical protein EOA31_36130 [Mesorhizobium sp. M4B.F.Ca.ET.049.02.1.2]RVD28238.1 hypothetical protein EN738_10775 [Mesorhizobium sp. M4B.F.Ca.ET.017.02.2.1]RWX59586.1 hypothetical protein EN780_34125 [Mesorhizobium sp. M4B.F.Ca.ET.089.01.1.1]TGV27598.1 hypothetical protein EN786_05445 [Mesorhizobium sp. M4B.F.Ca.ET.143.01.1.1]